MSERISIEKSAWEQLRKAVLDVHEQVAMMDNRGEQQVEQRVMFLRGSTFPLITGLVKYIETVRLGAVGSPVLTHEKGPGL